LPPITVDEFTRIPEDGLRGRLGSAEEMVP